MQTVLLVEDDHDNQQIFRIVLERSGFRVVVSPDGADALDQARALHPDLILMDISLPKLSGEEVTRRLKASPETQAIPVIALTSFASASDCRRILQAGCDGYIAKPVDPRVVADLVRRALDGEGFPQPM